MKIGKFLARAFGRFFRRRPRGAWGWSGPQFTVLLAALNALDKYGTVEIADLGREGSWALAQGEILPHRDLHNALGQKLDAGYDEASGETHVDPAILGRYSTEEVAEVLMDEMIHRRSHGADELGDHQVLGALLVQFRERYELMTGRKFPVGRK